MDLYELYYIEKYCRDGLSPETILQKYREGLSRKTVPVLPKGSKPKGKPEDPNGKESIVLQNDSAKILAREGYDVEMLERVEDGNGYGIKKDASPDYLIGENPFDCYSPNSEEDSDTSNMCREIRRKTKDQAERIVLNLTRVPEEMQRELKQRILGKSREGQDLRRLKELIVVYKDESIETWFVRW